MATCAHVVPHQSGDGKDFPLYCEAESGSITCNFVSSSQIASVRAKAADNADCQQFDWSLNASVLEHNALDHLTGSTRSLFIRPGHG